MIFKLSSDGSLVGPDGEILGRVIEIEIELAQSGKIAFEPAENLDSGDTVSERSERYGNSVVFKRTTVNVKDKENPFGVKEKPPTKARIEHEAIGRIWAYYLEVIPSRRKLDAKRERIISGALRLAGEEKVKQALLGLSRSAWHNGQNEQGRDYLEIRYALKGIGNESDDERIDKAIAWGQANVSNGAALPERIQRWLDDVRYHWGKLAHGVNSEGERCDASLANIEAAGWAVTRLDHAPWATVKR